MKKFEINGLVELNEKELKSIEGGRSWATRWGWWAIPVAVVVVVTVI